MPRKTLILLTLILIALLAWAAPANAHANLTRSDPPANAALDTSPAEIRLWFTEPLEPDFSRVTLRDQTGAVIETPPAQTDADDPHQLALMPGALPDGLYTVAWRVVSAADGHATEGSFAFGVGVEAMPAAEQVAPAIDRRITAEGTLTRTLNFFSLSLLGGTAAFGLFTWRPALSGAVPAGDRRLGRIMLIGWLMLGVSSVLALLLQASIATGLPPLATLNDPMIGHLITDTRFGALWLIRMGLWLAVEIALLAAYHETIARRRLPPAERPDRARAQTRADAAILALCTGIALTISLYSHASAAQEPITAVSADWLHLTATGVWVGGLIAFFALLPLARRADPDARLTGRLVAQFSITARLCVAALIVTGVYAAYLHVGSIDALTTTHYGRALILKLILIAPLLAIAAVNLTLTARGLRQGHAIWAGRLRGLIGAEVALTLGVLVAVGAITSASPSRGVIALREAVDSPPPPTAYFEMQQPAAEAVEMVHLAIAPGIVGENEFFVTLFDADLAPIDDATLIRLRFNHLAQDLGQSELRAEPVGEGMYRATGSNLSLPGDWRVRMTIQRPGQFDTVVDFQPQIALDAPPPPAPLINAGVPLMGRAAAALLAGAGLIAVGGYALVSGRSSVAPARRIALGALPLLIGGLMIASGAQASAELSARTGEIGAVEAWSRPSRQGMTGIVYLTLENGTDRTDRLIGAFSPAAESVELHRSDYADDQARMSVLGGGIDLPPGARIDLASADLHLMLIDLHEDLTPGDIFPLTLRFASGLEHTVTVRVGEVGE
jgi:copper transport protein